MKRSAVTLGILALVSIFALPAFARGPFWGGGYHMGGGYSMMGYGPGACWTGGPADEGYGPGQGYLSGRDNAFYDETAGLRNEILEKRAELDGLLNSPNPDPSRARALQKEITDLQAQLDKQRLEYNLHARNNPGR